MDYSDESSGSGLADQTEPEGIFQNMQYAYSFKDTLIYGQLLADDFLFTFRDYDLGYDVSWGREEEMKTTNGLFSNAERLDLIWNNIVVSTIDSVQGTIIRGFNLTITFNPTDIIRVDGRVNISIERDEETGWWKISKWIDESNF